MAFEIRNAYDWMWILPFIHSMSAQVSNLSLLKFSRVFEKKNEGNNLYSAGVLKGLNERRYI